MRSAWPSRSRARFAKGMHCPSLERAIALSIVLDMPVDQLFTIKIKTQLIPPAA